MNQLLGEGGLYRAENFISTNIVNVSITALEILTSAYNYWDYVERIRTLHDRDRHN